MKNKNILAVLLLAVFATTGCSDFLDLKPKGKDVPEKIVHYNGLFNNMILINLGYYRLNNTGTTSMLEPNLYHPYMSDEVTADATAFNNMAVTPRLAYTWQDNIFVDDAYSAEFGAPYQQIYFYNVIIDGVMEAIDGTVLEKKKLLAEARVMRAYMHFMLAQWFAKPYNEATAATDLCVPIATIASTTETYPERATVKQVYDFVIKELEEACPDLEEVTKSRVRTYQPAGYMYLGKTYFYMGKYDKAIEAFQKAETAIAKSQIQIGLFDYNVKISQWGYLPFMPNMWTSGYPMPFDANNTEVLQCKQFYMMSTMFAMAPTIYVKDEFMNLYDPADHRKKFFANKNFTGMIQYPHYRKQYVRSNVNEGVEMPDFYLMYAECLAREGRETEARDMINLLRVNRLPAANAPIPATVVTKDDLIRFIVEERLREYMGTGHRWFDMRRLWNDPLFQDLKVNYTHSDGTNTYTLSEKRLVYKIPPRVLNYNTSWIDNE